MALREMALRELNRTRARPLTIAAKQRPAIARARPMAFDSVP
jgi:hypothetical protein